LLTLAELLFQWHQSSRLPIWIATSAVLWALASVYSLTALVPINNRIASRMVRKLERVAKSEEVRAEAFRLELRD
jgi:Anthrone oxygenase